MFDFMRNNPSLMKGLSIGIFLIVLIILVFIASKVEGKESDNSKRIKKMTMIAMLSALSVLLYYFIKIPITWIIPYMPPFLDIHFSNVPIYIGGYLLGPISGVMISIVRFIVKVPATTTATIGELADLIIATATVLVTSIFYNKHRTKKTAIYLSFILVTVWMIAAILANWLIIIPFYVNAYGFDVVFNMMANVPGITESNFMLYYLIIVAVPFNLIISSLVSALTFFSYKKLSSAYDSILNK